MLDVFLTVVLPIFLVAGSGAILQRWKGLSIGSLAPITLYLLSPALIIHILTTTELDPTISFKVVAAGALMTMVGLAVSVPISRVLRQQRQLQSGFLLTTAFPNAGNMGLSITLLAFGESGLAIAVLVFVTHACLSWSVGLFIAARSTSYGLAPMIQLLRMPVFYAPLIAIAIRWSGWNLPSTIATPLDLLGSAAIPSLLLVLGFQLSRGVDLSQWPSLIAAITIRLLVVAPIMYFLTMAMGLDGVAQKVVITIAAMPSAVFITLLADEFKAEPRFVTSTVIASTVCSLGTLTILLSVLDKWVS
jgi:predicted permease